MKYQKGFSVLLTVVFVAVILVVAGGYIYYKTIPTPTTHEIVQAGMPAAEPDASSAVQAVQQKVVEHTSQAVLNSLDQKRQQGNDQKIKYSLNALRSDAEIYYNSHTPQNYGLAVTGFAGCKTPGSMFVDVNSGMAQGTDLSNYPDGTQFTCNVDVTGSNYAIEANLASGGYWCVDSSGQVKAESVALGAQTKCQ